jgi:hypothetical protein
VVGQLRPDRLVEDLPDVTFMDSSGLGLIVAMHNLHNLQKGHVGVVVLNAPQPILGGAKARTDRQRFVHLSVVHAALVPGYDEITSGAAYAELDLPTQRRVGGPCLTI